MSVKHKRVLVLNADWMPLTIVSWQRAIVLAMDERVTQIDFYKNDSIRDGHGRCYPVPAVIASKKYIKRDYRFAPFCKKNVLLRDGCVCQYCGQQFDAAHLTFDHVIPRSVWKKTRQGTPTAWENIVTSCVPCNRRKGDKTCDESGMFPLNPPHRPAYGEMFLGVSPFRDKIPDEWLPYLSHLKNYITKVKVEEVMT